MPTGRSESCTSTTSCAPAWHRRRARALPTLPLSWKPRAVRLQWQIEPVGKISHGAIEAAEQHDLEDLRIAAMRCQRLELFFAERRVVMQRIDGRDQRLLAFRPARRVGAIPYRRADLLIGQMR